MKSRVDKRVMRIWLSALLQSDLTSVELKKLSEQLLHTPELFWEFGQLLQDVVRRMDVHPANDHLEERVFSEETVEFAYALAKNRKLSKKRIFEYMELINPNVAHSLASEPSPISDILAEFFRSVSEEDGQRLLELLGGTSDEDAYLKGISRKR